MSEDVRGCDGHATAACRLLVGGTLTLLDR